MELLSRENSPGFGMPQVSPGTFVQAFLSPAWARGGWANTREPWVYEDDYFSPKQQQASDRHQHRAL